MKKSITLLLFYLSISSIAIAQQDGNRPQQAPNGGNRPQGQGFNRGPSIGRVYGKIIESDSKQTVPYASVVVVRSFGKKDSIIGGALTAENGEFNIGELPLSNLKVRVSFMGFKPFERIVTLSQPDNVEMDLGNLRLETDTKVLNEVEIKTQKTGVQLGLDKKVFNVDKNITATGGTAEDVFKNIPSVSVTADGAAQLRNQNTTVYVDGRPTVLSLNQIVADQIDQVEVITNPSAKYEASATGGIINIVTKKNKKPGYNGSVSVGAGLPNRLNGNGNLNVKEGRFNWQASANYMLSENDVPAYSYRTNLKDGAVTNQFNQNSINANSRIHAMGRLGVDYTVNNRNTFSIFGNAMNGQFDDTDVQDFSSVNASKALIYSGVRDAVSANEFKNYGLQAMWRKTFPTKGKELSADVTSNWSRSNNSGDWKTSTTDATTKVTVPTRQLNIGSTNGNQVTFQLDYTSPVNDSTKWEMGIRSYYNERDQVFLADSIYTDGSKKRITSQSTDLNIAETIHAAYLTFGSKWRGIGYQAGLRYEQSNFDGTSRLAGDGKFGYKYPSVSGDLWKALFPSIYLSKKMSEQGEAQLNFSRKINRPGFREIMPFIRQADNQSYSVGNPALKPEFITLVEANYNHLWKNHNWLISLYYRHQDDPIVSYSALDANNLIKTTFINGSGNDVYGLDNTLKLGLSKNIELTLNSNIYNQTIRVDSIENTGWTWNGKANLNWKLPKDFSTQISGNYESDEIIAQGTRKGAGFMDFALKKDFGRKASLTFSVNDVFNSRKRISLTQTNFFIQESLRRREVRNVRLNFQYRFGKMDASIFNKKRPNRQQNQQQEMDF
ncbi:MAG: TonB-dependent receptor [Saprospiraceae bacterium]|nr:TonB-dependent receptor [Saprospiraceae bacterium]